MSWLPFHAHHRGRGRAFAACLLACGVGAIAAPALADGPFPTSLHRTDQQRLAAYDAARAEAIDTARRGGSPRDVAELDRVLAGTAVSRSPAQLTGNWQCRTLKLGGLLPLTVYSWFRCRITDDAAGLRLEKLTGSQRTAGTFYDVAPMNGQARLGYAGAHSVSGEPVRRYGPDTSYNDVGYLIAVAPNRLRLELPLPPQESKFDILELRR